MGDVISKVDWSQVGPLLGLFLCLLIGMIALAPFVYRWMVKKEDHRTEEEKLKSLADEEERKRDAAREAKNQDAIIDFLRSMLPEMGKISGSLTGVKASLDALLITIVSKIDRSEQNISDKLDILLEEIRDQKQPPKTIRPTIPSKPK